MRLDRRQFLVLTTGLAAGCASVDHEGSLAGVPQERVVNAGPINTYASEGVYDSFRDQGFFVVRNREKLFVLSAFCTHRKCKLTAESDRSFYCKCHGSTFDPVGHVMKAPAKRDLPILTTSVSEKGELLVTLPSY